MLHGVAYLVDDAKLHVRVGEYTVDCVGEACKAVPAGDQDVPHAAVLQVCQHVKPKVGAFAVGHVHAKQGLPSIHH